MFTTEGVFRRMKIAKKYGKIKNHSKINNHPLVTNRKKDQLSWWIISFTEYILKCTNAIRRDRGVEFKLLR